MTKPEVHIENWRRHTMSGGTILTGNVVDHPRFYSGAFVYTSRILHGAGSDVAGGRVETTNTIYILGKPAERPLLGTTYAEEADAQ